MAAITGAHQVLITKGVLGGLFLSISFQFLSGGIRKKKSEMQQISIVQNVKLF